MKPVIFLGDSRDRIRDFPESARQDTGRELWRVQEDRDPLDWKPMPSVGRGVREIRVSAGPGEFRTVYMANRDDAIYVLHAFQKKSRKTPQRDLALAAERYKRM